MPPTSPEAQQPNTIAAPDLQSVDHVEPPLYKDAEKQVDTALPPGDLTKEMHAAVEHIEPTNRLSEIVGEAPGTPVAQDDLEQYPSSPAEMSAAVEGAAVRPNDRQAFGELAMQGVEATPEQTETLGDLMTARDEARAAVADALATLENAQQAAKDAEDAVLGFFKKADEPAAAETAATVADLSPETPQISSLRIPAPEAPAVGTES